MFSNKTVFILGAGASWHYGYPLGETLVDEVAERSLRLAEFFRDRKTISHVPEVMTARIPKPLPAGHVPQSYWEAAERECVELNKRLRTVHPLVIDYFLAHSPGLQSIGRFIIAWVILECDAQWQLNRANRNRSNVEWPHRRDNWCRFLLYKLTSGCRTAADLLKNDVTFVTFNYDVSLERELYEGLSSIEMFGQAPGVLKQFFTENRFLHMYGKVRDCPPAEFPVKANDFVNLSSRLSSPDLDQVILLKEHLDLVYAAAQLIRTIDPDEKDSNDKVLQPAKQVISDAACLYLLGYGFDGSNNKRLGLERFCLCHDNGHGKVVASGTKKCILFTNYDDRNQVNKKVSNLFLNCHDGFLTSGPVVHGDPTGLYYVEKSVRDVYGALGVDFDDLETQDLFSGRGRRV